MVAGFGRHAAAAASCVRHFPVLADTFADWDAVRPQENGCYDFAVGEGTRSEPRVAFGVLTFMFRRPFPQSTGLPGIRTVSPSLRRCSLPPVAFV